MTTPFGMTDRVDGGCVRIGVAGEIDLAAVDAIRARVRGHLDDPAVTTVIVDLVGTTFIDSSGVGVLVGCRRSADDAAKAFRVVGAAGRVARVLDVMGMTAFLAGS